MECQNYKELKEEVLREMIELKQAQQVRDNADGLDRIKKLGVKGVNIIMQV